MPTRNEIISAAREWVDTPFHHQARCLGVGVDCGGVLIGTLRRLGLPAHDMVYGPEPDMRQIGITLRKNLTPKPIAQLLPSDVLWLSMGRQMQHIAIYTDENTIIHAAERYGRCVEHTFDDPWRKRVRAVFEFPGVV
jgi:hypothetical protein